MQHEKPVSYEGYAYVSPLHLLQYWYTSDYDGYENKAKRYIKAQDPLFYNYLLNEKRPFLSTGDLPLHSLLYAYGLKLYKGHEHERLRPKWHANGKAERPYSGKVYVSIHPLTDFIDYKPSHITSWFNHGFIPINNLIAAERETSFLGFMPKDRTAIQHKAKYPSFKGAYKKIYAYKYGIDENMYKVLQDGFKEHAPHTAENRNLKSILGDYLCAYHEVRLIEEARKAAEAQGKILIYRDQDGLFSLDHPATPSTAVKENVNLINAQRELYRALANIKTAKVKVIEKDDFKERIEKGGENLTKEKKKIEYLRFFDSKQKIPADPKKYAKLTPIPVLTAMKN